MSEPHQPALLLAHGRAAYEVYREFRTQRKALNVLSVLRRTVEQETSYAALPGASKRATPLGVALG